MCHNSRYFGCTNAQKVKDVCPYEAYVLMGEYNRQQIQHVSKLYRIVEGFHYNGKKKK